MSDWRQQQKDGKRDKTITLRASTNDLALLDGLVNEITLAERKYYKYSRMDLIIDALTEYRKIKFPATDEHATD